MFSTVSFTAIAGGTFTVIPTQVVFEQPGKVKTLTVINQGDELLNTQSIFKTYVQVESVGKLVESNNVITGVPSIMATPVVVQDLAPNTKQDIRLLAIKQSPESETVYRYYVKNLNQQSIDSSGTQFEIAYGVPVFILPQHVNESYNFSYATRDGKSFIKVSNIGNVHVLFKELYIRSSGKAIALGGVGRLLAGSTREILVPANLAKDLSGSKYVNINVAKSGLVDFERESQVNLMIRK